MQSVGGAMMGVGGLITAGVTLPILGAGGAAIKLASDAEEAGSKFDVVFGGQAQEMNRWVEDLRTVMPATTAEIQGMASSMQDLLVPIGVAPEKAQDMTKEMVTLAGDLASFNNLNPADVMNDLQAAMVGNYESMDKYGTSLTAANVEQEALRMGLAGTASGLTDAQKAQAAYSLILSQTTAPRATWPGLLARLQTSSGEHGRTQGSSGRSSA